MSKLCPYGTRIDPTNPRKLLPEVNEASNIEHIKKLHHEGYSLRGIAKHLNENKIPARGKRWTHTTIGRILTREGLK